MQGRRRAFGLRAREWLLARDLELVGAALLVVILLFAFIEIADFASDTPRGVDERILLELRDADDPYRGVGPHFLPGMMRDVTALGSATLAIVFSVALVGWLLLTGRPGAAFFVVVAIAGASLLNDVLKDAFERERPTIVPHLMDSSSQSFPSGHTMISAVLYPTMAEIFGRLVRPRRLRYYLMSLAILAAILVGFSRVYLGVHYPSDVIGGLCIGFAWALLCGITARRLQRLQVFRSRPKDVIEPPESNGSAADVPTRPAG
jgi:undecaprenyl-diphosphatase